MDKISAYQISLKLLKKFPSFRGTQFHWNVHNSPSLGFYPEPGESSSQTYFSNIRFNIILSSTSGPS
jgi:hypothetical protein